LLDFKAKNGDSAAAVALSEILGARAEGRRPDVRAAHARAGTLPGQVRAAAPVLAHAASVTGQGAIAAQAGFRPEPQVAAITQWDLTMARESASQTATTRERERWAKVFGSVHSKGRERVCATLLSAPKGWSADAILAELPTLPTDQQQAGSTPAAMAAADASWDRAYGLAASSASTTPTAKPTTSTADAAWAKAYGVAPTASSKSSQNTGSRSADDVWARAYGSTAR